ncbi:SpoIIE family protein phosphatase [Xanthomonadaceae bacterium XH05]|nr:SpoIIE family protein phosphatase [Xanthomonadaceae bacterium XH05]
MSVVPTGSLRTEQSSVELLAFLAEVSQQLAVSVDLTRTLRESATYAARYLEAEAVSVFLVDADTGTLVCRACQGPVDILGLRVPMGKGIVGRTVASNESQMVRDAYADPDFVEQIDAETGFVTRSVLCAPLATAQGVIGAIEVINKRDDRLFDEADLTALRLLAAPMALALNIARMAGELVEQNRIRRELGMARRLQRSLLPRRRRGAYPLRAINLAAQEISGDFYDFFDMPDGRIAFTVGDVAGKGLDAAFLMVRCASLLRWSGKDGLRPADWLARVNDELGEAIAPGMFVCAVAGHYDPATREAVWASAGFPPLLRVGVNGDVERFEAQGPPLGILRRMDFPEQRTGLIEASLYLYSDGVTDVRDVAGEPLGVEGVEGLLRDAGALAPEPRMRALVRQLRGLRVTDDITLMLISDPPQEQDAQRWSYRFPAQPRELSAMRHGLAAALARAGVDATLRQTLVLAVDEACSNIIRHAYGGPSDALIQLHLERDGDELHFELLDDAPCCESTAPRPRDLSDCRPGGLGINFIDSLMDHWSLTPRPDGCGNRLWMVKRIETEGHPR